MYVLFAVPLAPEAIMPQRLKNAPAIDQTVHFSDRQHTTELIAVFPYGVRFTDRFPSQTECLEDAKHAEPTAGTGTATLSRDDQLFS